MQTMDSSLVSLVRANKISYETALAACHNAEELNRMLGRPTGVSGG
jgi:Tfp pilus assembly ATPase PilU